MIQHQEYIKPAGLVFFFTFAALVMTATPLLGPFIFSDEGTYSLTIQEGWNLPIRFSNATIPNYLFYAIYHVAFLKAQSQSLIIARILNALFLSATAVIFFVMLRNYLRTGEASVVAIALALSYFGIFSILFMPESLFFFLFWLAVYFYVFVDSFPVLVKAAGLGALTALLALTKPHGLAVAAGWTAIPFLAPGASGPSSFRNRLASVLVFGLALAFSWVVVSYAITGAIQTDPVGGFYSGCIKLRIDADSIVSTGKVAFRHIAYLAFFSAFPLLAVAVVYKSLRPEVAASVARLLLAGAVFSAILIAMCAKFTVDVAGAGPYESLSRIHMRYYLVSMPLFAIPFFICARTYVDGAKLERRLFWAGFPAYVLGVLTILATRENISHIDSPLLVFALNGAALYVSIAIGALAFGLAALGRKRYAVAVWLIFFFSTWLSSYFLGLNHWWTLDMGRLPRVAGIIKECLPGQTVAKDVVFISEVPDVRPFILQYHLGATVKWYHLRRSGEVDCNLVATHKVVVTFGNLNVGCGFDVLLTEGDTTVLRSRNGSGVSNLPAGSPASGLLWTADCFPKGLRDR